MFIPITDSSFSMPPLYRAALHRVPPKNIRRAPYEPTATPFFGTPYPHFISVRTPSLTIEALLPHRLRGPKAPTVVIYLSPAPPNTIQVTFCTALSVRYMHIPRPTLTHPYIPYEKNRPKKTRKMKAARHLQLPPPTDKEQRVAQARNLPLCHAKIRNERIA